jgi:hypothetical protein
MAENNVFDGPGYYVPKSNMMVVEMDRSDMEEAIFQHIKDMTPQEDRGKILIPGAKMQYRWYMKEGEPHLIVFWKRP